MASHVIAVTNRKGGTGKTTTAVTLAASLSEIGLSVLVIDTDTLGHAGLMLGHQTSKGDLSIHDLMQRPESPPAAALRETGYKRLSLICADRDHSRRIPGSEPDALRRVIANADIQNSFDVVVVDTSPAYNEEMVMALTAAQSVLVPFLPHPLSLEGMRQLNRIVLMIRTRLNPDLKQLGFVATQVNARSRLHNEVIEAVSRDHGETRFLGLIRNDIKLARCSANARVVFDLFPQSNAATDYHRLTRCVLERWLRQPIETNPSAQDKGPILSPDPRLSQKSQ